VAKIEVAIKDAILRGAKRQIRIVSLPVRREVRRLRRVVGQLRRDVASLRDAAAEWQRVARATPWRPEIAEDEVKASRLSPRLVRTLRARLGLTQAALSRLVGVSPAAVVQWERGRAAPAGANRRALIALRKLGRRDVRRLLTRTPAPAVRAKRRPRRRAAKRSRARRRARR
jgi:DNA-binding transcriptional regulator YiaG